MIGSKEYLYQMTLEAAKRVAALGQFEAAGRLLAAADAVERSSDRELAGMVADAAVAVESNWRAYRIAVRVLHTFATLASVEA